MENINRQEIRNILIQLEETAKKDYSNFEIALLVFLRSDIYEFDENITDSNLEDIKKLIENYDSLLDIEKEDIDSIIYEDYEEEKEEEDYV